MNNEGYQGSSAARDLGARSPIDDAEEECVRRVLRMARSFHHDESDVVEQSSRARSNALRAGGRGGHTTIAERRRQVTPAPLVGNVRRRPSIVDLVDHHESWRADEGDADADDEFEDEKGVRLRQLQNRSSRMPKRLVPRNPSDSFQESVANPPPADSQATQDFGHARPARCSFTSSAYSQPSALRPNFTHEPVSPLSPEMNKDTAPGWTSLAAGQYGEEVPFIPRASPALDPKSPLLSYDAEQEPARRIFSPPPTLGPTRQSKLSPISDLSSKASLADIRSRLGDIPCVKPATKRTPIDEPDTPWTPLTPYFQDPSFPTRKKGGKVLIGEHGWLHRPGEAEAPLVQKKETSGFFKSIKSMAKSFQTEAKAHKRRPSIKETLTSELALSLDPREQSLLYGELEFQLHDACLEFLNTQHQHGRIALEKQKKVNDEWLSKGRPPVVAFGWDLEKQLDLIEAHVGSVRFGGRRQANETEVHGLLQAMKVNARSMRLRTYCQPDCVISKHIKDTQALFDTLTVSNVRHAAIAGI